MLGDKSINDFSCCFLFYLYFLSFQQWTNITFLIRKNIYLNKIFLKKYFFKADLSSFLPLILNFPPHEQLLLWISWITFNDTLYIQLYVGKNVFFKTTLNETLIQRVRKGLLLRRGVDLKLLFKELWQAGLVPEWRKRDNCHRRKMRVPNTQ